jgi:type IV secretion system protein VirB3
VNEAVYKGATRPAMKWGVPLMTLVLIFMPGIVLAFWGGWLISAWIAPCVVAVLIPLYAWMRFVTFRDDQRLLQMVLRSKLVWSNPNRRLWKARSYTPHLMRKPGHVRF